MHQLKLTVWYAVHAGKIVQLYLLLLKDVDNLVIVNQMLTQFFWLKLDAVDLVKTKKTIRLLKEKFDGSIISNPATLPNL